MGQSSSNIRQVKVPELLTAQGNVIAYEWDTRAGTLNTWDPMEKPTLSCRHVYDRAFIDSLIHPDDRSRVLRKVKTGLRGRGRFEVEFRILTAPDKYVWVRDHGRTVSSEESTDGAVRGLFISVSSYQETIQELSSANATVSEKLRQSDEINNAILKSLEGFAHVRYLDPDLRIHWDNEEFTLERLSKNDLSALTHCYEITHGKSNRCTDCPVMDALRTGEQQERENTLQDGQSYIRRCCPVRDATGAVSGIIHIALNVTKHKKTEEGLRTINAFLHSLLENSPTPVCVTDREGRVETVNKAWEKTLGISESNTVGRFLADLLDKENAYELARAHDTVLASNSCLEMEVMIDSRTGPHHFHTVAFPLQDGTGSTNAVGSIFVDVTERKRAEEELTKNEGELRTKSVQLEEMNTALRVLLRQRESDQQEIEQRIVSNVKELVLPYVNRLKHMHPTDIQLSCIQIIEAHLNDIITPFLRQAVSLYPHITAKELQVATLVREGRTNKDIADFMHVSLNTVELHRYNLRRKLGIQNKKVNLRSFLLSLDRQGFSS